ncbi:hypothetical protein ACQPW3_17240 [Actinosynnema sp. CA-248983]
MDAKGPLGPKIILTGRAQTFRAYASPAAYDLADDERPWSWQPHILQIEPVEGLSDPTPSISMGGIVIKAHATPHTHYALIQVNTFTLPVKITDPCLQTPLTPGNAVVGDYYLTAYPT